MTSGEKQVWAAAYAKEFKFSDVPAEVIMKEQEWAKGGCKGPAPWGEYEKERASSAAEYACGVVSRLRTSLGEIAEGHGDDSDVYQMAVEMLVDQ